jgi:hypothetical protein
MRFLGSVAAGERIGHTAGYRPTCRCTTAPTIFARRSIACLHRTFTSFELLIVDDGSTDATPALIESFTDPRLVVIGKDTAVGVARSLNLGLHAARGEYIARLDADDLCQPERLTTQITRARLRRPYRSPTKTTTSSS